MLAGWINRMPLSKNTKRSKPSPTNLPSKTKMVPDSKTPRRGKHEVSQVNADETGQRLYSKGNQTQHTICIRADI